MTADRTVEVTKVCSRSLRSLHEIGEGRPPSGSSNAPSTTSTVGHSRNSATKTANGSRPTKSSHRRNPRPMPPSGAAASARSAAIAAGWLDRDPGEVTRPPSPSSRADTAAASPAAPGQEHGRAFGLRQVRHGLLVDRAGRDHGVQAHRPGEALQPDVLALIEYRNSCHSRAAAGWGILVDRLDIESANHGALGHHHCQSAGLPGPRSARRSDTPSRSPPGSGRRDGGRGRIDRQEVAGLLELTEELDARRDVVGEPPLASAAIITPLKPADACVGLPFSATLPRNSGLSRSSTLVTAGTLLGVVADRHVAAVVADPETARVLERVGDVGPGRHLVRGTRIGIAQGDIGAEIEHVGRAPGRAAGSRH